MNITCLEYYSSFKCEADSCNDTCCKFWQVELDRESHHKYKELMDTDKKVGKCLKSAISGISKPRFRNDKAGNCVFLNDNNLCNLYTFLGHENLPYTCKMYPRFINNFGGYEERGLSFSCPAAAKLIFENEQSLISFANDEPITQYTDIDALLFSSLRIARDRLLDFLFSHKDDVARAIPSIIDYAQSVQLYINNKQYSEISKTEFRETDLYSDFLTDNKLRMRVIKSHIKHKHLRNGWRVLLINALESSLVLDNEALYVWMYYFIYRYALKACDDYKFSQKVTAGVLSYLVIGSLDLKILDSIQKYSKETEHNQYNKNRLFAIAEKTISKYKILTK